MIKRYWWLSILLGLALIFLSGCNLPTRPSSTPTSVPTLESTEAQASPTLPPEPSQTLAPSPTGAVPSPTSAAPQPTKSTAPGVSILDLRMFDASAGWGVGTYQTGIQDVLRTQDGASAWKVVSPPEPDRKNRTVVPYFMDASHAWVIYTAQPGDAGAQKATIWRTADGGSSWQSAQVEPGSMTAEFFSAGQIGFSDAQNGWLLVHMGVGMMHDYVSIWKTADGGASWKAVVDPTNSTLPMSCYKNSLWFTDAQNGFLAGNCAGVVAGLYFYVTSDGGSTWAQMPLPAPTGHATIFSNQNAVNEGEDLVFKTPQWGYLLVRSTDMNTQQALRWVYVTQDGGNTWKSFALPTAWGNIAFLDPANGWYLAGAARDEYKASKVSQTTDSGASWKTLDTVNWIGPIQFVNNQTGWVIAKAGGANALVRSKNGGASWELLKPALVP